MVKRFYKAMAGDTLRRLLPFVKPHWKLFGLALISMVFYGATDGALPFILKHVLDDIFGQRQENMLWFLVGLILGLAVIRGVFGFLQRYLSMVVGLRVTEDIRNVLTDQLLKLSADFYSQHTTGSLVSRMTNDTLLVRRAITEAFVSILRDTVRVIALLTAAIILDPVLASIAFLGIPLGFLPVVKFSQRVRKLSKTGQEQFGGLTAILHEVIVGHKVVQSFAMEDFEKARFNRENRTSTNTLEKAEKYASLSGPVNELLGSLATAGVIVYGGLSVINGTRTQGDFIAFITAMLLLYEPIKRLTKVQSTIQQGIAAGERVLEVLDSRPSIVELPNATRFTEAPCEVEFDSVSFRYPEANLSKPIESERPWTLDSINLKVPSGSTVALVGSSGGGKSTLVNLLPRFYDVDTGSVRINGRDVRDFTLSSLRKNISIVSQHTFLFNDTVANNIRYGRAAASIEEVEQAAKAAHADIFIRELPEGYDTEIGEQGLRLSGGQRARIAIARAMLKNAPILVLDEATASLDSESEELVQQAIDSMFVGRTVLVIAHRLATVRKASSIVVISGGKIVEMGTHSDLLSKKGEYSKLYQLQFRDEDRPEHLSVVAGKES